MNSIFFPKSHEKATFSFKSCENGYPQSSGRSRSGNFLKVGAGAPQHWADGIWAFPRAFLYPLRIAQRLPNSLWVFPSGFPTPFEHFLAAVQQLLRPFPSGCRLKRGNFQLFFLKGRISVNIFKKLID
jgi:hypothetical protein